MKRLNFACGSTRWLGFENSDIHGQDGTVRVDLDEHPLPYDDDSAEIIMLSHGLQLTNGGVPIHADQRAIMAEFHRILMPGGWLRIDENPWRVYVEGENLDENDRRNEMFRGYPDELRIPRGDFLEMLREVGFDPVLVIPPTTTQVSASRPIQEALIGNHLDHVSFTIEAQKAGS